VDLELNRISWLTWEQLSNMWGFFQFNDVNVVNPCKFQKMKCSICHNKGLVMCNKNHGTNAMNLHVASKHFTILVLYQTQILFTTMATFDNIILKRGKVNQLENLLSFFSIENYFLKK